MQAFHNDPVVKDALVNQLQAHYDADEIIKGVYWEDGKGCAIGCAIHSHDHNLYEQRFNIPKWLARVQDTIFEGLPNDKAKEWPILFTKSVNIGSNLDNIKIPFLIFIVESVLDKFDHKKFPLVKKSIDNVIFNLKNNPEDKLKSADSADAAADSADAAAYDAAADSADAAAYAADAAAYAADAAAYAYAYADAAAAADSAAYAASYAAADAYAAAYAADAYAAADADADADADAYAAADSAAYAAAYAAADAYAAAYAAAYAKYNSYVKFSEKLIELIKNEKGKGQ